MLDLSVGTWSIGKTHFQVHQAQSQQILESPESPECIISIRRSHSVALTS